MRQRDGMPFARLIGLLVVVSLTIVACSRDEGEVSETTVTPAAGSVTTSSTTAGAGETTIAVASSDTPTTAATATSAETAPSSTTALVSGLPSYEVVHRLIEDDRETLIVVVEPGSYSNVELENLVYDIVERFSPSAVIVVDDPTVADLAIEDERTEEQQAELDTHTFLRIENGVEVTFYGPYADFPGLTIGS